MSNAEIFLSFLVCPHPRIFLNDQCVCKEGFAANNCDRCEDGYYGFPDCKGTLQIFQLSFP